MQHHHHPNINDTFHSKHVPSGNVVLVMNADNYVMAEYYIESGRTVWQRLVLASQREKVENWLAQTYPSKVQTEAASAAAAGSQKGSKSRRA